MANASKAGALCALIVFLIGFTLGTIPVLLIVPRLGETAAVLTLLALAERDFRLPTPVEGPILAAQ